MAKFYYRVAKYTGKWYLIPAMQNEQIRQIEKKAYEIAYGLFRLSGNLNGKSLAAYMENHALSLFDSAIYGNQDAASRESKIIEYYLRLGGDIGILHQDNVAVMIAEIGKLNSAIAELPKGKVLPEFVKLSVSKMEPFEHTQGRPKPLADIQKAKEIPPEVINKEIEVIANGEETDLSTGSGQAPLASLRAEESEPVTNKPQNVVAEMRQSAIMKIIRQAGNPADGRAGCRMRDIIEALPNVSERTIRYDLERLSERGLVERIGQGGPSTAYRAREVLVA